MTEEEYNNFKHSVDGITPVVTKEIEHELRNYLDKCGLFYKCFVRIKSGQSACEKVHGKIVNQGKNYKMQDLIGIRIVVYFKEDIALCEKIVKQHFDVVNISKNPENIENFGAQRINYVCKLPLSTMEQLESNIWKYPVDHTFEIQMRTIFSEGWHEIEHDFRYKCKEEWKGNEDLARTLNGIFATLDNCDWAIDSLFTQLAYRHYKEQEWISMLKNVFRMRLIDYEKMDEIIKLFNDNHMLAKQFFRLDREDFLIRLSDLNINFPLKMNTVVYLVNLLQIHSKEIYEITPDAIKKLVEKEIRNKN